MRDIANFFISLLLVSALPIAYIYAQTLAGAFTFYPWYHAPIRPILAAVGIVRLARRAGRAAWLSATAIVSVLVVGQLLAVRHPPVNGDRQEPVKIGHEATVSRSGDAELFYLEGPVL